MKKAVTMFVLIITMCIVNSTNIKAATLTDEEYAKLKVFFSDMRISVMSDEEAKKYLNSDLDSAEAISKYYKVTPTNNGTMTTEVSKEEAENAFDDARQNRATFHDTSYKNIQIMRSTMGKNKYIVNLMTRWLVIPKIKSFDVIAMRTEDATVEDGSQFGTQAYKTSMNGSTDIVSYSPYGTNIVKKANGYGISMNLVNDGVYFECDTQADIFANTKYAEVYGSYQHATKNVTLEQSQAYNISHNGYGEVLNFTPSIEPYYDEMKGVSIPLPYTP